MNPAFSVVLFTALAGTAQGLVVVLALATLGGVPMAPGFVRGSLLIAGAMGLIGLLSSFGHLGRKDRAWRAVLMWRTSWLSRECIALPAFLAWVAWWCWALPWGNTFLPLGAIALAALLWLCTAKIYACLRFIQEWAQPLTLVNFTLIGLASGSVLASALAGTAHQADLLRWSGPAGLLLTLAAWFTRALSLRHNAALKQRSTLASATGIKTPNLLQKSMGMSAGSFNTREFFHGRTLGALKRVRLMFQIFGFALPALLAIAAMTDGAAALWWLAVAAQAPGVLAERWFFFAQARHPQNLYYQVVS